MIAEVEVQLRGCPGDPYAPDMTPIAARTARSVSVAVAALFVVASCGSIVDDAGTEKDIKANIPGMAEADIPVTSVKCPDDQDFVKGATFDCDFTVEDGSKGAVKVTITSEAGDGKTEYSIARYASGQVEQYLFENTEVDVPLTSVVLSLRHDRRRNRLHL